MLFRSAALGLQSCLKGRCRQPELSEDHYLH
jgi:hypothetical protein